LKTISLLFLQRTAPRGGDVLLLLTLLVEPKHLLLCPFSIFMLGTSSFPMLSDITGGWYQGPGACHFPKIK